MKRIYLIIAGAFLVILIITSMILSFRKKPQTITQKNSPFPTDITRQGSTGQQTNQKFDISTIKPVETKDFKLQYSPKLNKIVVEKKTLQAEKQFIDWANQNRLPQLVKNSDLISIVDQKKYPDDFNLLIEFLNIFMNFGQGSFTTCTGQACLTPTLKNQSLNLPISQSPNSLTYFPQCGDLGNLSLPNGCDLCRAGCGPTTVAMIAASYLGSNYDPKTIVDIYKSKGYLLGCEGSRYTDARQVLQSLGLKTTDYLVFNAEKSDTVAPELKNYLNAGWTFFSLVRFCDDPKKGYCGHFFWITDIDDQNNIWAYDPAYGRDEIPYNENGRYPYPLYRVVFGVKK